MSIWVGTSHTLTGNKSMALGNNLTVSGDNALAVGEGSTVAGQDSLSIGSVNNVNDSGQSMAIGYNCHAQNGRAHAFGYFAYCMGSYALSLSTGYATVDGEAYKSIAMGYQVKTYAPYSIAMGSSTYVYGYKSCGIGDSLMVNGQWSLAAGGKDNQTTTEGKFATVSGYRGNANRYGEIVHANGRFGGSPDFGQAQISTQIARNTTTNATPTTLFLDGSSKKITIASDQVAFFEVSVLGLENGGTITGAWTIKGVIHNDGGTTALQGTLDTVLIFEDDGAWDATVEADDTNDALSIIVTGKAGHNVRWVAKCELLEVLEG